MANDLSPADRVCDVLVAGSGLAGLTAAIAFAAVGFDVVCCGTTEKAAPGRTVALLDRSVAYLDSLGIWALLEPESAPMRALRIVDDTGALFPPRLVEFLASEIGLDAFGWNVENEKLAERLAKAAAETSRLERRTAPVAAYDFAGERAAARLADGGLMQSALIVGADGRSSLAARSSGLTARVHRYPQSALTTFLAHRLPHRDVSTEFHTREGPFTLVPLPGTDVAPNRSSLVWVMSDSVAERRAVLNDEALALEIERHAHSLLGAMQVDGPRGLFPMARQTLGKITAQRLALVGDAAHAFPPIGAQGLNLGLRDVQALVEIVLEARAEGGDIGSPTALARYERARASDILMRTSAVGGLNRALLSGFAPIDFARGAGLAALAAIGPLRRFVMREGVAPRSARERTAPTIRHKGDHLPG